MGYDVCGNATLAVGKEGEASAESVQVNPLSGWIRAPWRHPVAINESERLPIAGAEKSICTAYAPESGLFV